MHDLPDFRSTAFLTNHVRDILRFYDPVCVDAQGGFFHFFLDDGTVYDQHTRHLVSSTRFVFNYAQAARLFDREDYRERARHGLRFLHQAHRQPHGGYAWLLEARGGSVHVLDGTRHCYGHAFVLLAHAAALQAGIEEARPGLDACHTWMHEQFWQESEGLYADEATADGQLLPYRGQNANMHACEALIAAYDATGERRFLAQAKRIARRVTVDLAAEAGGLVWEHYGPDWRPDWDYNRDDPKHLFRPWGFQPGHQTEWAKLLLTLHAREPQPWLPTRAKDLFDTAVARAWDEAHGGLVYGVDPQGRVCDGDKYFWVQAESLAAAARLALQTGDSSYWDWYDRLWTYAWEHFVDHEHGAWYRILDRENRKYGNEKSPAGKTDYHTLGACLDVLAARAGA
ncbi:MAG TPA: AGE family epimerase/isomerase [Burkholderiaceae bacterium]|nr:AGE family epimerase/isomerase [Burkholderiaceae bacterium]